MSEISRIIVKNLPLNVTSEDVKKHFMNVGTITDVNLKYKDGIFRRFAFIGYKSPYETEAALNHYNGVNKQTVEPNCEEVKNIPTIVEKKRKKQKYRNLLTNQVETLNKEKVKELLKDNDFISYLKANGNGASALVKYLNEKYHYTVDEEQAQGKPKHLSDIECLEKLTCELPEDASVQRKEKKWKDLFTVVIRTKEQNTNKDKKGRTLTKKCIKTFLKPLKYKSLRIPPNLSYLAYVGFQTEKEMMQLLLKDKSFIDGVRVRIHKYERKEAQSGSCNVPWREAEERLKTAPPIMESGKIFVRNLWYSTTEEDLKHIFEKIGPVAEIVLPICKETRKLKGFAHVSFLFPEHAAKALSELDGTNFQGRTLHILPSLLKEDEGLEDLSFKDKKIKNKYNPSAWHNWNSLFLGTRAVVDLLSEKLGRSKQEILRNEGERNQSVAASVALGEAQLVEETKRFLEEQGVSLESFHNPGMQRSSTTLLVKHLPAHTTAQELSKLFSTYGLLGRVLLPPSGLTGIVEFLDTSEAKLAYKELAYSRFKHLPLYLEWAPIQTFNSISAEDLRSKESEHGKKPKISQLPTSNTTLYVKNLNFKTTEQDIKEHFSKIGPVYGILIAKRRCLSLGYGFVQYYKSSDAKRALRELQNSSLLEHYLDLKMSEKTLVPENQLTSDSKRMPVILVKNIPFESSRDEIKELFKTFGDISALRLPKNPRSEHHRGFCFVEFVNLESAQSAFSALSSSTHLRGRRLVLEWAIEESIEDLRKRTAEHFLAPEFSKRREKILVDNKTERD